MSYPRQDSVSRRLHDEIWRALDAERDVGRGHLEELWDGYRKELRLAILTAYDQAAHENGKWSLPSYRKIGIESYLAQVIHNILARFYNVAQKAVAQRMAHMKAQAARRYAYVLDQMTPDSMRVRVPDYASSREARVFNIIPDTVWQDRWGQWVASYEQALRNNLAMNAMNQSDLKDAMDEVDATRVNTPASTLKDALFRMYEHLAEHSIAGGEDDVARMNDELMDEEIWKTRGGACDDCLANDGLTIEESDGDIPLHPNCRCRWVVVPRGYSDLLRSGNSADRELADEMERRGIVPEGIVVRDDDGNVIGRAIVSFSEWSQGQQVGVIG